MGFFTDKVAVLTGGASGIGRAVGEALAREGALVVLADVQVELGEAVVESVKGAGGRAEMHRLDVTDPDAVASLLRDVCERHGRLDLVFNNAGINVVGELRDTTLDQWDRLIDVNIKGVVHGCQEAYAIMREQGHGHIVNTASVAGLVPPVGEGAYAATKHAVVCLSMVLRAEGKAFGVQTSAVCPGVIGTPMVDTGTYNNIDKDELLGLLGGPSRLYPVERAAKVILGGVRRNRGIITITAGAKIAWWIQRLMPAAITGLSQPLLKRLRSLRKDPAPLPDGG